MTFEDFSRMALELVTLRPEEVVMAAAHAYDLRGAQRIWIRTEKVERVKKVKKEFDVFLGTWAFCRMSLHC